VTAETGAIVELSEWLKTEAGQYVLSWEQARFDEVVADLFGFHAFQVGLAEPNFLRNNRIPFKAYVGADKPDANAIALWDGCVLALPEALPFEAQSVDLLVLPHTFECTDAPHNVLREVERVLMPEGRVVITGFNPWSLWGAHSRTPGTDPVMPHPPSAQVSPARLKDWLQLLSFEIDETRFGRYAPACQTDKWLKRWHFMESAGEQWWPVCGAVYMVSAVKRVAGVRLLGPPWKKQVKTARAASAVAQRESHTLYSPSPSSRMKKKPE
jgi:SAM-dependent methyltransferase